MQASLVELQKVGKQDYRVSDGTNDLDMLGYT